MTYLIHLGGRQKLKPFARSIYQKNTYLKKLKISFSGSQTYFLGEAYRNINLSQIQNHYTIPPFIV